MTPSKSKTRYSLALVVGLLLMSNVGAKGQDTRNGIRAEVDNQKLSLRFDVTCAASNRITLNKYLLPWENVNSIVLVAVTTSGETLQRDLPIEDPTNQKISLNPAELVSGSIDLRTAFRGLDRALGKGDVNLFWAYNAPKELGIAEHSGGWILLRQRR